MIGGLRHPLLSCEQLERELDRANLVLVDCRHSLSDAEAGRAAYLSGHIPGARHADLDRDLARRPGPHEGRHPLPDANSFVATLRRLGVSNNSSVVVYDDCGGAMAARLWWMLAVWLNHADVAVLDGGINAWVSAGLPLEQTRAKWAPGSFVAAGTVDDAVVTTTELSERLENHTITLLDARAAPRFEGVTEPIDPVAGHVPGAINLPFSALLAPDGTFLSPPHLRELLEITMGSENPACVVAMCGSGVTACHLLLGMSVAGLANGRLYVGSWSEWIRDPARATVPPRAG